jgi:hypothetical protein
MRVAFQQQDSTLCVLSYNVRFPYTDLQLVSEIREQYLYVLTDRKGNNTMATQVKRKFAIINFLSLCIGRLHQRELHEKGMYDMCNKQTVSYKNLLETQSMGENLGN